MNPGRELDALIAEKVMELEVCKCDHIALKLKHYRDLEERRKDPYRNHNDYGYFSHGSDKNCNHCGKLYVPVVNYSTDITAAWEVVDKIYETKLFHFILELLPPRKDWWARFCEPDALAYGKTIYGEGRSSSPPHAICLAALKAMGINI